MELTNDDFIQLYATLYACVNSDGVEQLDIYNQLKSLYQYFDKCVFHDSDLENGKTYILPMDIEIGMFEEEDYAEYIDPDSEDYDPDLAPFIESHNKHIEDGTIFVTLKAGTQFTCDNMSRRNIGPHYVTLIVDGYAMDWYENIINEGGYDGAAPFVIKA